QQPYPGAQQPYPGAQQPYPGTQPYPNPQQQQYYPGQEYMQPQMVDQYLEQLQPESAGTQIVKKAKSAGWIAYYIFGILYNAGLSLFSGVLFGMTHIWTFALATLIFITLLISDVRRIKNKKYPKHFWRSLVSSGALLGLVIYMMMTPVSFKTTDRDKYGRYVTYTNMVTSSGSFFPTDYRLPKDIKQYKYRSKRNAYKKNTWTSLRFKMDPESDEWTEFLERMGYELDLYDFSLIDDDGLKTLSYYDRHETKINGHYFKYDEDFWDGNERHAYVIYPKYSYLTSGLGANESRVIIINWEKGMIEFSQLVKK
ncbi:MAG: hypothetical protein IJM14_00220, partial [Lachnospiraceae bacterium]|nr:hypothetical protein [Lachnospiraceae bacterium]